MFNNSPEGGLELSESCCTHSYGFSHQKGQEDPLEKDRLPTPGFLGFLVAQLVKNLPAMWETWV